MSGILDSRPDRTIDGLGRGNHVCHYTHKRYSSYCPECSVTFDPSEPASRSRECSAVVKAASLLGLREYEFFRLAYRRWFGQQPTERILEKAFAAYMLREQVPPWVRQLARDVRESERRGALPHDAFGANRYRDRPARPPHARLYVAAAAAAWLVFMVMLLNTRYDPVNSGPATLCLDGGTSNPIAVLVTFATGKPPPACLRTSGQR